jgi:DNA-binding LytR/AlgR family response regulator
LAHFASIRCIAATEGDLALSFPRQQPPFAAKFPILAESSVYSIRGVTLIPVGKLDYAEAQDDYVALASQGRKHLKQQTIASLEARLNPDNFVRIHRSYIVNLERVVRIEPYAKESRIAILTDGARLPVSRAGYVRLKSLLDERS